MDVADTGHALVAWAGTTYSLTLHLVRTNNWLHECLIDHKLILDTPTTHTLWLDKVSLDAYYTADWGDGCTAWDLSNGWVSCPGEVTNTSYIGKSILCAYLYRY